MRLAVDVSSLLELRQLQQPGKPDAIARVVTHFLEETGQRLATLHRAIETGDAKLLEQAAHALKGMVVAEMLFAVTGLGGLIIRSAQDFRIDKVLVVVLVIAVIGVLLSATVKAVERYALRWQR